ncbi:MAG: peptide methionine sulfoxide reductase [Leeuwenhoekiella sp.]|uniref:Peptide methionine sulfoxide reductase n=1 Tax=Leeuwenhoekiella nanhaiensis TaxID=1655491 RepID=A0A2G1VTQ1_9FLAO|nr:peptide methionine sulfoxide reductase [Leeuwenhoekiella nanhaiensis]PHQ30162.1 peptide methionine sulfoxide reductase [Leeuwenhoekiella nanhaiensis]PHR86181.1 MAG: peptide methionine sulfoxide reductase [Leeuwenhoekiella sp.]
MKFKILISRIPEGYSEGSYNDRKYGITRTDFNAGKSLKVYAEELGGTDFISLNYYETRTGELLKPCEMPEAKVIAFLKEVKINIQNT